MKTKILILLTIISINALYAQRINDKQSLIKRDSIRRAQDSIISLNETKYARFMSKKGNLIGYVDSFNLQMKEWAFVHYGIYLEFFQPKLNLYAKLHMDSLIFNKYGKSIYKQIKFETDSVFKNVPSDLGFDSTYFGVIVPLVPYYSCGYSKLYTDIDKLLGLDENVIKKLDWDYSIEADFIINKDGSLNNPRILKSINPTIETKLIQILNKLPCKWLPAKDTIGNPQKSRFVISIIAPPDSSVLK